MLRANQLGARRRFRKAPRLNFPPSISSPTTTNKLLQSSVSTAQWRMSGALSFMSAAAPSRLMLRHSRFGARHTARRHASTTEVAKNTAAKSKETASNVTSKASEGLSRVTSSGGSALSGAAQGVNKTLGNIGGRLGSLINIVQCESESLNSSDGYRAGQLRP
jgi:hypothetical protein